MKCWLFISAAIFFMFGCVTNDSQQPPKKELFGYKHIKQLPAPGDIKKGMSANKVLEMLGEYTNEILVHQGLIFPDKKGDYERRWLVRWKIYDIKNNKPRFLKVSIFFAKIFNIKKKMHKYPVLREEGKSWFVNKIEYKDYPYNDVKSKYEKKKHREALIRRYEKEVIGKTGETSSQ